MSAFRPQTRKTGNLPHLSFIMRKPEDLGTEFKVTADTAMNMRLAKVDAVIVVILPASAETATISVLEMVSAVAIQILPALTIAVLTLFGACSRKRTPSRQRT